MEAALSWPMKWSVARWLSPPFARSSHGEYWLYTSVSLVYGVLTLSIPKVHQINAFFNPKISFFSCLGPKWALDSLKKLFCYQTDWYFNLVHAHKPKFGLIFGPKFGLSTVWTCPITRSKLFSCPFPLLFLGPFTLDTFCVSYSFRLSQTVGC